MQEQTQPYIQDRTDARACLATFILHIPYLILIAVAGALLGSGLYLLIATIQSRTPVYYAETEYYIDFADGRMEAKDYYNGFTWNDVMGIDPILGRTMEVLGSAYDREQIRKMITAEILSDVRYLTVTVEGTDPELVGKVSQETKKSLENYGSDKDEFDSIYQIEDNGVKLRKVPFFTWRAAVLGALLTGIAYMIVFFIHFHMAETFYTRADVIQYLQLDSLGMLMKHHKGKCSIDIMCTDNLDYVQKAKDKNIVYLNLGETSIEDRVCTENTIFMMGKELNNDSYKTIRETSGVVIFIPWGISNRSKVTDVIQNLHVQDCTVLGAVLVDADQKWLSLYGLL